MRTPHKGDEISASDQKLLVEQARDKDALQAGVPFKDTGFLDPFVKRSQQVVIGKIVEVLGGAGKPRYKWELMSTDSGDGTGAPTYVATGQRGNNECYPYAIELGRGIDDLPSYAVDDLVLISAVEGETGTSYVILRRRDIPPGTADWQVPVWDNTDKQWTAGWPRMHG